MTEFVALRHAAFRELITEVDHIVALCEWTRQLLLVNGVPGEKITLCRHGLAQELIAQPEAAGQSPPGLRVAFLGRLDPTKGVHVLIEALRMVRSTNALLDIYGITQGKSGADYETKMRELAGGDRRILFHPSVPSSEVVRILRQHDILAVPSQWMETGPLVVLEAFAAGIPVIGSNLGGIAELIKHQTNGLLVESKSPAEWARTLQHLADHPELLAHLRSGIRPPRKMDEVADEMAALYHRLTSGQAPALYPAAPASSSGGFL
jgi:glycosyltransferase involved in cell wall biosynthesis